MTKIIAGVKRFVAGAEGASVAEYAVALLLIAVVTLAAVATLGDKLSTFFANAAQSI
jgi:Flp pilus assembly pilin Flp